MNTGKSNIYTFGFKTRPVGLSRGNKLGNNAFVEIKPFLLSDN